jgi:1,4-alpha-glucan branching enzyme
MFRLSGALVPDANRVCVVGDLNKWETNANPMQKLKSSNSAIAFNLESKRKYQFCYLIDKVKLINNQDADKYVKNPYENIF